MFTALLTRRRVTFLDKWCQSHGVLQLSSFFTASSPLGPSRPRPWAQGSVFSPANHSPRTHLHSLPVPRSRASHFVPKSKPTTFIFYFEQPWYSHFFSEFPCFPVCRASLSSYFPAFLHLQHPLFSCLTYPPCSPLYLISLFLCLFVLLFSLFFQVHPSPLFLCFLVYLVSYFLIFPFSSKLTPLL